MPTSVGKDIPRFEALDKAQGKAVYTDDISYPNMWFASVVRAKVPRGKLKSLQLNASFDWNSVVTASASDIPGDNIVAQMKDDQQFLVTTDINHQGEALLLIAAPTKELAEEAKRNVTAEYEELPPVLTIEESRAKKAIVYGADNIITKYETGCGDPGSVFKDCDLVVEAEYRTPHQEQAYLEPQAVIAVPRDDGGFTIEGSLQCPYYVLKAVTRLLKLPKEKINVRQVIMGGAFGGKEDYPSLMAGYAVLLAKKCNKPVKIVYDRNEDILYTTKRHPSIIRHKTGVKKDGTIVAMDIDVAFDGGAYMTLSSVVLARGLLHSWGPYKCANVRAKATCYATNTVPTGAFRGFGAPQALFAIESHIDVIADRLGLSPLTLRRMNCLKEGDTTPTGQVLRESVGALDCLEKAALSSNFEKKWEKKKGIGLSLFMHGAGFTGSGEAIMKSHAAIRLEKDGSVTILTGCTDMGQGSHTVLPQIAAQALNLPVSRVRCAVPDTSFVPDSGPTVASRTTMVIGKVVIWCCEELLQKAGSEGLKKFAKKNGPFTIEKHYELPEGIVWDQDKFHGDAYPTYAWGCNVAEVGVDPVTLEVTVKKMITACDVGKAINPQAVEGQLEGGALQAVGYATCEGMAYKNGLTQNNRFQTYIIPTVMDAPEFKTIIVEKNFSWGPYGAKGLGELPHDGAAPAIANAVFNAVGVRISELPVTAEKIHALSLRGEKRRSNPPSNS